LLRTLVPAAYQYITTVTVLLLFQNNIGGLKFEPDSDNEADVTPINVETEFIDIKKEETPDSPALEADGNEELHSVSPFPHDDGGIEDVSIVGNFPK
jgi:hypothetical protein